MSFAGFALGAANAANAFNDTLETQRLRDQKRQEFEWERRRAEAEMSVLDEKTAAQRSGYKNDASRDDSELSLRPGETANKLEQQRQDTISKRRAGERQGTVEQSLDYAANTARDTALVNSRLSEVDVQNLPNAISLKQQKNVLNMEEAKAASAGAIAKLVQDNNNAGIVRLMNDLNAVAPPDKRRSGTVAKVGLIDDGRTLVALDADEKELERHDVATLKKMADPTTYTTLGPGATLVAQDSRGARPVLTAPDRTRANMSPLQRDVEYLTTNHAMTPQQALTYLSSAKTQSKADFIRKALKDDSAMSAPEAKRSAAVQKRIKELGDVYDSAQTYDASAPGLHTPTPAPAPAAAPAPPGAPAAAAPTNPMNAALEAAGIPIPTKPAGAPARPATQPRPAAPTAAPAAPPSAANIKTSSGRPIDSNDVLYARQKMPGLDSLPSNQIRSVVQAYANIRDQEMAAEAQRQEQDRAAAAVRANEEARRIAALGAAPSPAYGAQYRYR